MLDDLFSVAVFISALLIVVFAIILSSQQRKKQRIERQRIGLIWLHRLRVFLSHVQQHRGMTSGYLSGGTGLLKEIKVLGAQVNKDISEIVVVDPWMKANSRWVGIEEHWLKLSANFQNIVTEDNLRQHNTLIKNILYLIEDMAQEHELLLLKTQGNHSLHLLWRELLAAGEFIGQARAIGMGVATAKCCDSISRIRLNYLCQKIESNTQLLWSEISPHDNQQQKVESLLRCINDEIIKDVPSVSPSVFFDTASDALNDLYLQYDQYFKKNVSL